MNIHWGTFTLDTPHSNALRFISARLQEDPAWGGYKVWDTGDRDYHVIARQDKLDVGLTVVCVPLAPHSTWVSVIASSLNSQTAEQERNLIRANIQALGLN